MFSATTRAVVKNLGAEGDLIYNENVNEKIKMLTLVKVQKKILWPIVKYTIIDLTLLDLLEEPDVCADFSEEILTEAFKHMRVSCGEQGAGAGVHQAEVSLKRSVDSLDGTSTFALKKKMVDMDKLRKSCTDKRVRKKVVNMLKLKKTEKLTFVYELVYSTEKVTFFGKASEGGCLSAAFNSIFKIHMSGSKEEATEFTVLKGATFAYGLMEITTEDSTLEIPPRTSKRNQYNNGWWNLSTDGEDDDDSDESLPQVLRELKMKERILQPLQDLPKSTCRDLLKALAELLEDRRSLTLLEQMLDQDSTEPCDQSPPQTVSSFMTLLEASGVSSSQKDALHLLVSALDCLPEDVPAHLTRCPPDAMRVLNQLVDGLKDNDRTTLPESLPPPLQEGEDLRWAAKLLCCSAGTLAELKEQWDRPELPPGILLEMLSVAVRGLSLMLPTNGS